jgi:hypothetical protein
VETWLEEQALFSPQDPTNFSEQRLPGSFQTIVGMHLADASPVPPLLWHAALSSPPRGY